MSNRWLDDSTVGVCRDHPRYPSAPPFHPSESYPEWPAAEVSPEDNAAYRAVRGALLAAGLDAGRCGTADWNPFGALIRPGDTVLIKPNLVSHRNMGAKFFGITDTDSLVTHGSVIRAVFDYAARALDGAGTIIIGDCPVQGSDWHAIVSLTGLDALAAHAARRFPGVRLAIRDFRLGTAVMTGERMAARRVDESRRGEYEEVDLGRDSALVPLMSGSYSFGVAQYPRHRMRRAHSPDQNLYLLPKAFLDADVVINVPKLKSHMKAGVTCALKNFVGLNGHKDYLPHFRFGSPRHGGDEYPDGNWLADLMWSLMHADWERDGGPAKAAFYYGAGVCNRVLRYACGYPKGYTSLGGGSWFGNDTVWRMILDINRAFLHYDASARRVRRDDARPRRYFAVIDGLVGGHRESPLAPTPYPAGLVLCGANPVAVDTVATAYMGFDWRRVKQIARAYESHTLPLATFGADDVRIFGDERVACVEDIYRTGAHHAFEPSLGYRGHIEYVPDAPRSPAAVREPAFPDVVTPPTPLPEA